MIKAIRPVVVLAKELRVPLTRGLWARVSKRDRRLVEPFNWTAQSTGNGRYYAARRVREGTKSKIVLLHRVLLNAPRGVMIDHRNRDPLDNRRENLRRASAFQNAWNVTRKNPFVGVVYVPRLNRVNPWMAYINARGRRHHLGYFKTLKKAVAARRRATRRLHGRFASL